MEDVKPENEELNDFFKEYADESENVQVCDILEQYEKELNEERVCQNKKKN